MLRCAILVGVTACAHPPVPGHATSAAQSSTARSIPIQITTQGFEPDWIDVNAGDAATLVFTRQVERTCVKRVVVELDGEHTVERDLPLRQPIAVPLAFDAPGELGFSCAMAMKTGTIHVHAKPLAR